MNRWFIGFWVIAAGVENLWVTAAGVENHYLSGLVTAAGVVHHWDGSY